LTSETEFPAQRGGQPLTIEVNMMKRIRFKGARRKGTLTPRRLWAPGEVLKLDDDVADELAKDPEFQLVKPRKRKANSD